jgi:putative iron-only hydrogenase system regulator
LERRVAEVGKVNELIHEFGDCVVGRLGLPYPQRGVNVITLVLDTTVDRLSAFTGKLGKLPGTQVKALMAKVSPPDCGEDAAAQDKESSRCACPPKA